MDLLDTIRAAVGPANVRSGDGIPPRNWADAAEMPPLPPEALIMPATTEEVATVLGLCFRAGQPLVVQGGMTGLAGGSHPRPGEIALSLERLKGVEEIDVSGQTMIVRAGTTLQDVQAAARAAGLHYGVDLGARGSCTIGGNVATNAGGVQALRYGVTRKNVLGLEAVLADGTVLTGLNRMMKNNTGYDWPQLLIGSEGTLGVITRVSLSLTAQPEAPQTALCAVANVADALTVLSGLEKRFPGQLLTFEGMWREYMEVSTRLPSLSQPFAQPAEITLLIEVGLGDSASAQDALTQVLSGLMEDGVIADALIAQSLQDRQRFWAYREANYEFHHVAQPGAHFDISLPFDQMQPAIAHLRREIATVAGNCLFVAFGHLADGNLHLSVHPQAAGFGGGHCRTIVYDAVGLFDGSISAEHGIGILKRPYLDRSRSPAEIAFMKTLKRTIDPAGILNRGRIFTLD